MREIRYWRCLLLQPAPGPAEAALPGIATVIAGTYPGYIQVNPDTNQIIMLNSYLSEEVFMKRHWFIGSAYLQRYN